MTESGGISKRQAKWIGAAVLITLVVVVAMQNWEDIGVTILFAEVRISKFLLIVTAFGAGAVFGWMTRKRRRG